MGEEIVALWLHHSEAAEVEACLRRAAKQYGRYADAFAADEKHAKNYLYARRLSIRYAELADIVKRRSDPNLTDKEPPDAPAEKED